MVRHNTAFAAGSPFANNRRSTCAQSQPTKPKRAPSSKVKQGAKGKTQQAADDDDEEEEDEDEGSAVEDDLEEEDEPGATGSSAPVESGSTGRNVRPRLDGANL